MKKNFLKLFRLLFFPLHFLPLSPATLVSLNSTLASMLCPRQFLFLLLPRFSNETMTTFFPSARPLLAC